MIEDLKGKKSAEPEVGQVRRKRTGANWNGQIFQQALDHDCFICERDTNTTPHCNEKRDDDLSVYGLVYSSALVGIATGTYVDIFGV